MTASGLAALHKAASRLAALLMVVALLSVIDALTEGFRKDFNTFHMLPGNAETLTAPLPPKAADLPDVRFVVEPAKGLRLTPQGVYKGFWMGGTMWKAEVTADADAAPGEYVAAALGPGETEPHPTQRFRFIVFSDREGLRAKSSSYCVRLFDVAPYAATAGSCAAALVFGLASYLLARQQEERMRLEGKAEIYMLKRSPEGMVISFGLGERDGLFEGAQVAVCDETGHEVGRGIVVECAAGSASARLAADVHAELGHVAVFDRNAPQGAETPA